MTLFDIMKKNQQSQFKTYLPGDLLLRNLKATEIIGSDHDEVGITDEKGEVKGSISLEKLRFIIENHENHAAFSILENIEEGIIALDREGRIFYTNKMYSKILGVSRSKVIGRRIQDIEEDATIIEVLKTGKPIHKRNLGIKSLEKYVEVHIYPIFDQGEVTGAYSIFNDITELRNLNREVKRVTNVAKDYLRQNQAYQELKKKNVIGRDPMFLDLLAKALAVAETNISVLVRGENGVGKEIITQFIHKNSLRKDKPLISINCAAIPENLIESELFGYEEGAFTGAIKQGKVGKFMLADGGTLFLDEIGDMPMALQSKLLRVLQEGEMYPLGAKKSVQVDVRIIAATNQPLEDMISNKLFRQDLYYRLNAIMLQVPSLRDRGDDIILFANFFLNKFNDEYGKDVTISRDVYQLFLDYSWPGNVRELINCMRSSVILCNENMIHVEDLPASIRNGPKEFSVERNPVSLADSDNDMGLKDRVKDYERRILQETLDKYQGNREKTLKKLKVSRRTFYRKLEEFEIK